MRTKRTRRASEGEEVQGATGLTAERILEAARTWSAQLIVLGSVAGAVVRGADIPVMTVRERRETPGQTL